MAARQHGHTPVCLPKQVCMRVGYRHIDAASIYKNQDLVGRGLAAFISKGRRAELFITTKIWNDEHSPAEARGALERLVDEGLVKSLGVSNFSLGQIADLLSWARIKPVVNQVELHPFLPQRKLVEGSLAKGVHTVAYSPLGHSKTDLLANPVVIEVAKDVGVLLRWNVDRGVAVIPKAGSLNHVKENLDLFSFSLSPAQQEKLDALENGKRFVSTSWHSFDDRPVEWAGQAFSYLLHHPKNLESQSYAQAAHRSVQASAAPGGRSTVTLPGGSVMPLLGIGTYKLDSVEALHTALDAGYRHVDCASVYKNQELVGKGLADFINEGRRAELFITTKIWNDEHAPEDARRSVLQSIAELGCQYADLVLIHWPHAWKAGTEEEDPSVTLQDTWGALERLVDEGHVRNLGVSNFSLGQIEDLLSWACIKPVVNQVELHPFLPQRKLVGGMLRKGLRAIAYSPLGHSKTDLLGHPVVEELAKELDVVPAQVLLRWNVQRGVGVIPKAGSAGHVRENADIFSFSLTYAQKAKLDALENGKRFVNSSWHTWED
ncbi:Alcohol dehydrogenase [NADP(+)] [Auxenochlorella protothecoides]|uniref:Alcohol dehydrogenase [NADP(+)] n=1 Tax=Auxenochlorella protothecoides TaxID=3075 RepID=A0A087SEA0_AUXPR|nr:Alcohol dehydrogenase [NADP(+)] [Auxenochlorella protothecoides]KFM24054.1 Alcohol dehydrogenase [NADP(+)] [Auxenochlorella protothecoides]